MIIFYRCEDWREKHVQIFDQSKWRERRRKRNTETERETERGEEENRVESFSLLFSASNPDSRHFMCKAATSD